MQYESPDPFHDRQLRKRRADDIGDRLLIAGAILAALALVAVVGGRTWPDVAVPSAWSTTPHPVAP
ncbi:hypothetical protein ACWPMX_07950 [Tsuneonella sp. HG094]